MDEVGKLVKNHLGGKMGNVNGTMNTYSNTVERSNMEMESVQD